jgi:thiol:disulfide interchange protein DsbA
MKRLALLFAVLVAVLPVFAWAAPAVEGRDYALIEGGAPYEPLAGKIEVAEVFAYWCDHCARFQPMIEAWQRNLPKDVRLAYVPLPSGRDDAFARGFFAVQDAAALAKAHAPLFVAVHDEQSVPRNPSIDELSAWYGRRGLDAAKLRAAMASPALVDRLAAAHRFAVGSGVEGTPTLVINGRYRILGRSLEELLRNADAVIAQLRTPAR